eukprot:gene3875-4834_t
MGQQNRVWGKQVTFSVSPFHQKLFANYFKNAIPLLRTGVKRNFLVTVPYFAALAATISWANETYHNDMKHHWY